MELNVGQLIRQPNAPAVESFERFQELFSQIQKKDSPFNYELTFDERFSKNEWINIVNHEILLLYNWLLKRLVYSKTKLSSSPYQFHDIYCFQPRYGITLHLLRRVIPFALLNLKTNCIFADEIKIQSSEILNYLTSIFETPSISIIDRKNISKIKDNKSSLLLITGKVETFQNVNTKYKKSTVIGSTGNSSIVITDNLKHGQEFLNSYKQLKQSCTSISSIIFATKREKSDYLDTTNNVSYSFQDLMRRYNPTIIHDLDNHFNSHEIEKSPYLIIQYAKKNLQPQITAGICSDPIHGYPGDYLI